MAKFRKGDKVAMLASWDNKGTVSIRRGIVHSAGSQLMRLQDEAGVMFKAAYRPEHNVMGAFNGIRIIADADKASLEAEALLDGARVVELVKAECEAKLGNPVFSQSGVQRCLTELHAPVAIWK